MPITYLAAFFGGVIALFTPCSALIIPMFAAAMTNKKHNSLVGILYFSIGLMISLLPLALGAVIINQLFSLYRQPLSIIIGILLILSGIGLLVGHHLVLPDLSARFQKSRFITGFGSLFTLGLVAGLGSTTCIGPILGAILSLSAAAQSPVGALGMMLMYALGLLLPLLFITLLYESFFAQRLSLFRNATFTVHHYSVRMFDLFAAALLIFIGLIFVFHQGSFAVIPAVSNSGLLDASFDLQDKLFLLQ